MFSPRSVLFYPFLAVVLVALASTRTLGQLGFGDDVAEPIDNWDAPAQIVNGLEEDPDEEDAPVQEDRFGVEVFEPLALPAQIRDSPPSEDSESLSPMSESDNSTLATTNSSEEPDDLPVPEEDDSAPSSTTTAATFQTSEAPLRADPKEEGLYTIEEEKEDFASDAEVSVTASSTETTAVDDSASSAPPTPSRGSPTIPLEVDSDIETSDSTASSPTPAIQDLHFWLEVFRVARWPILIFLVIVLLGVWILGGCAILVLGKPCLETRSPMTPRNSQINPTASTASSTFYASVPSSDPSSSTPDVTSAAAAVQTTTAASTAARPATSSEPTIVFPKTNSLLARRRQSLRIPVGSLHTQFSELSKGQGDDSREDGSNVELDSLNLSAAFSKLAMPKTVATATKAGSKGKGPEEKKGEKEKPKK